MVGLEKKGLEVPVGGGSVFWESALHYSLMVTSRIWGVSKYISIVRESVMGSNQKVGKLVRPRRRSICQASLGTLL